MPKTTKKVSKPNTKTTVKPTCSICLDSCKNITNLCNSNEEKVCSHQFCFKCIKKWEKNTCPNCREPYDIIKSKRYKTKVKKQLGSILNFLDMDVPPIVKTIIDNLVNHSQYRHQFLKDLVARSDNAINIWKVINPVILLCEMRHSLQCDIPWFDHFPEFSFYINMIRRFDDTNGFGRITVV